LDKGFSLKYLIETYGCQMNKAESSALELIFRERGWQPARPSDDGVAREASKASRDKGKPRYEVDPDIDLVVINTCSVRATAENRAWGRIDLYAAAKRDRAAGRAAKPLALVVTGCMAERLKREIMERQSAVDYVVGTFQKQAFGLVLDAVERSAADGSPRIEDIVESPAFVFADSYYEPGAFRSFVPIMHGCDNFCAYCIVPYIRGRELSRAPSAILSEIASLEASGVRELTLLGQNVNSYRWRGDAAPGNPCGGFGASRDDFSDVDREPLDFPGLLKLISAFLGERGKAGIRWVRFLTSHPKDLSAEVIRVLAEDPLFCKHVHLCVQSGSDAVLEAMNRRYTRRYYLDLVERMRAAIPGLSLSTDILVGFPGETEEDLELTLELMGKVGYSYSYMYHFNPREGTPAASMPGRVPDTVKRERLARVIELQKGLTRASMESRLGSVEDVLVEGPSRRKKAELLARTQRDEMVVFAAPASRVGGFARVLLTGLSGNTFKAEEVAG
jgi:tRNA-2-methylthio-N6-dimethylallyladenosine synthase